MAKDGPQNMPAVSFHLDTREKIGSISAFGTAVDPSGRYILTTGDSDVRLQDLTSGHTLLRINCGPTSPYPSAFGPGSRLAAWANLDGTIYLCDLTEINELFETFGYGWK